MFMLCLFGLLVAVAGVIAGIIVKSSYKKSVSTGIMSCGIIIGIVLICFSCVRAVPTGHTA